MDRRAFLAGMASIVVAPLKGVAQPARVRIGMLETSAPDLGEA